MARIFKHTYTAKDKSGKRATKRTRKWYIEYRDAAGVTRRVPGFVDKRATEQHAAQLERQAERERAGIIDVPLKHLKAPIQEHIDAWLEDLERSGRSPDYMRKVRSRIEKLKDELCWGTLVNITADGVTPWLAKGKRTGLSPRTLNHYIEAVNAFSNWCVAQRRLEKNPVSLVPKVEAVDPTFERRAATDTERLTLLETAPPKRRLVYLTAMLTGLRRSELRQLRWGDIHLDHNPPYIQPRAQTTKSRRADSIPMTAELVEALQPLRPDPYDASLPVFESVPKMATFKSDLEDAGIDYEDAEGRRLDFHALRVTFGSMLAAGGTALRTAMELMRHTDIRLTTRIYTDPRLLDTVGAVNALPRLQPKSEEPVEARGTGTDGMPTDPDSRPKGKPIDNRDGCEKSSDFLVSGLVSDLPERCSSHDQPLTLVDTNDESNSETGGDPITDAKGTCDADWHPNSPPDSAKINSTSKRSLLEAGGIEPPSRDISDVVSTCVVVCIKSRPTDAQRQASGDPAS